MAEQKVPKSRLNQIAQQKLTSWGVQTQLSADGERLEGTLDGGGRLQNPLTGQAIETVTFTVEGHDRLVFLDPPVLRKLAPLPFFDHKQQETVIEQIRVRLNRRVAAARQMASRTQALGLPSFVDPELASFSAEVELPGLGKAVLVGDENGLFADRLVPPTPNRLPLPLGGIAIDLRDFGALADLQLFLSGFAQTVLQGAAAPRGGTPPLADPARAVASCKEQFTLERMVSILGPDACLAQGAVVQKDLQVGGKAARFAARYDGGPNMTGRIQTTEAVIWTGPIDLEQFPGIEDFVAGQMGCATVEAVSEPPKVESGSSPFAVDLLAHQSRPLVGEIWVMAILVERDDSKEVRYVGVNTDGKPFGAPRVLSKADFEHIFTLISTGVYRLPVEVIEVGDDLVGYFRLDPGRNRSGEITRSRLTAFVANFTPEAASY